MKSMNRISLQEFMSKEGQYTIRLRNKDMPEEDRDYGFYLHFDEDSYTWVLHSFKRVPRLRGLSKDDRKHLWSKRWRDVGKEEFKTFSEAKHKLMERAQILMSKGYKITGCSTVYDLPPW